MAANVTGSLYQCTVARGTWQVGKQVCQDCCMGTLGHRCGSTGTQLEYNRRAYPPHGNAKTWPSHEQKSQCHHRAALRSGEPRTPHDSTRVWYMFELQWLFRHRVVLALGRCVNKGSFTQTWWWHWETACIPIGIVLRHAMCDNRHA